MDITPGATWPRVNRGEPQSEQKLRVARLPLPARTEYVLGVPVIAMSDTRTMKLFLRRQLALYVERRVKPRRIDAATRVSMGLLSRLFDWRSALVVVRPETVIRWHRMGWKLFWRLKSRPGRPPVPAAIQALIRQMASENPLWGQERIANELLLKLGIRVSPRTVRKYLPRHPRGRPRGDLRWSRFLRLHARGLITCDFFVAVTARFRLLYVLVPPTTHALPPSGSRLAPAERRWPSHPTNPRSLRAFRT